jgi:hypothetical protein
MLLKAMIVTSATMNNNKINVFLPLRELSKVTAKILPDFTYSFLASL